MPSSFDQIRENIFSKYKKENWEIKTLGEIALEMVSGNEITKIQLNTGNFPAVKCGDINSSLPQQFDKCVSFVNPDLITNKKYFENGDILISKLGDIKTIGKSCLYKGNNKCLAGNDVEVIKHQQNPKFLTYALSNKFVRNQIKELIRGTTVFHLHKTPLKQIKIPFPPIETQKEIADILDKFYILEQELERELENRKKQYEYYKNLIFERGINELNWELKTLGEIAIKVIPGNDITKRHLNTGDCPTITCLDIFESKISIDKCKNFVNSDLIKNKRLIPGNSLLISERSNCRENVGKVCAYMGKEECLVERRTVVLLNNQNSKYLSYALSTKKSRQQFEKSMDLGIFSGIKRTNIKKIKIPLPSLEEQERVVEMLDKLYAITNDIKKGIPSLIQKNREQYNFYKEFLISPK